MRQYTYKSVITLLFLALILGQVQLGYAQTYRNDEFSLVIAQSYIDPCPLKPPADFLNERQQQKPQQMDKRLPEEALAVLLQALVMPINGEVPDTEAEMSSIIERYLSDETSTEEKQTIIRELARRLEYDAQRQDIFTKLFGKKCRGRNIEEIWYLSELYKRYIGPTSGDLGDNLTLSDKITMLIMNLGTEYNQKNGYAKENFEELISLGNSIIPHILKAMAYGNDNIKKWSRLALNILCEKDRELFLGIWDIINGPSKEAREAGRLFTNEDFAEAIKKSGIVETIDIDYLIDIKLLRDITSLNISDDSVLGKRLIAASQSLISGKRLAKYLLTALTENNSANWKTLYCMSMVLIMTGEDKAIAVPALIQALKDEDKYVCSSAAAALGKIGDKQATSVLIEVLRKDENEHLRSSAAEALGKIRDKRAVPALIETLKEDGDEYVRGDSAMALGQIGDKQAISALTKALKDKKSAVRGNAAIALGEIKDKKSTLALIEILNDENENVRRNTVWALGEIGDGQAVPALKQTLKDKSQDVRLYAVEALYMIGKNAKSAIPALVEALNDENGNLRRNAVWALGEIGDSSAIKPLEKLAREDSYSKKDAEQAIRKIKESTREKK